MYFKQKSASPGNLLRFNELRKLFNRSCYVRIYEIHVGKNNYKECSQL